MRKLNDESATSTLPSPVKPLPNQLPLPFDLDEARRQVALFDSGGDLPGAGERDQKIIWDLPVNS